MVGLPRTKYEDARTGYGMDTTRQVMRDERCVHHSRLSTLGHLLRRTLEVARRYHSAYHHASFNTKHASRVRKRALTVSLYFEIDA
jgi:hypothetical protein